MYGVPANLPLQPFVGKEFNFIGLGRFQIQLHVSGTGKIYIEGHWELRDAAGTLIDQQVEHAARATYQIHRIIDVPVIGYRVDPPRSFSLMFEGGLTLTVMDNSPQYESFSVHIDGQLSEYV